MSYSRDFTRPSGEVVHVEYSFQHAGADSWFEQGDPPECEITKAYLNDEEIELADEERLLYEEAICCDPPEFEYDVD